MGMDNHKEKGGQKVDVVIVGAGAAGLHCAQELQAFNSELSFVVLEARNRVGGRIYSTLEETRNPDVGGETIQFYRDHGASWIHGLGENGNENPIVKLLREEGRDLDDVIQIFKGNAWMRPMSILHNEDAIAIFENRERIPNGSNRVDEALKRHYAIQRKISEFAGQLYETGEGMKTVYISVEDARVAVLEAEKRQSEGNRTFDPSVERLYPFYTFLNENWNGISSSMLPLYAIFDEDENRELDNNPLFGDYPGPHCKIQKGMQSLLDTLVPKLEGKILLGQEVKRILRLEDSVCVESSSGLNVIADCCICTLPLGCLKSSASSIFQPSLTAEKLEAISSISAGNYKKVFLTFNKIFWPADVPLFGLIRDGNKQNKKGEYLLVYSLWAKNGVPCLEAVLCGDLGEWARGKSDEELMRFVTQFLADTMPVDNVKELCTGCHVTRWEEDKYSMGSYSSVQLGSRDRHIEALGALEWKGRLVFAGEATESEHMGSVHAALISGQRAVHQVRQFLESNNTSFSPNY